MDREQNAKEDRSHQRFLISALDGGGSMMMEHHSIDALLMSLLLMDLQYVDLLLQYKLLLVIQQQGFTHTPTSRFLRLHLVPLWQHIMPLAFLQWHDDGHSQRRNHNGESLEDNIIMNFIFCKRRCGYNLQAQGTIWHSGFLSFFFLERLCKESKNVFCRH